MRRQTLLLKPELLEASLPKVWCDFNASGWSGAPGDECYYVFDKEVVTALNPIEGTELFAYDKDGEETVIGCVARLNNFNGSWRL